MTRHTRPTDRSLPIALLRARETVMEPIRDILSQSGISEQKWRILRVVDEQGPVDFTTTAKAACLLRPSLTRLVRSMEDEGLLERQASSSDRRQSFLVLTQKGRDIIAHHMPQSQAVFTQIDTALGREKLNQLLDLLEDLQEIDLKTAHPKPRDLDT